MSRIKKSTISRHLQVWQKTLPGTVIFCIFVLAPFMCFAAVKSNTPVVSSPAAESPSENGPPTVEELLKQPFTYQRENRSDPFRPFLQPQGVATSKTVEDEEDQIELTGMQLFEPGQLTLVAIVLGPEKGIAMVQDSVGKGYVIEEGTYIGRRGIVEEIAPNVVLIKEWYRTSTGAKKFRNIEMVLRKEGEK